MKPSKTCFAAAISVLNLLIPVGILAQPSNFAAAISINGQIVSNFEIDQRSRMLRALGIRGDREKQAREALIDEHLFLQEAERNNIKVTKEEVDSGISEYAARANLNTDELLTELAAYGVAKASFEEFVRAGYAWRKVVADRFLDQATSLAIDEIDQRLPLRPLSTTVSVQLSELIIPLDKSSRTQAREVANAVYKRVRNLDQFEEAVRRYSVAESRQQNGDIGWISINSLPDSIQRKVAATPVGTVVPPEELQNRIHILFKRNVRNDAVAGTAHSTQFSTLRVSGESRDAAREAVIGIMDRVNTCDDLHWEAANSPTATLTEHNVAAGGDLGIYAEDLDNLDDGEMTVVFAKNSSDIYVELLVLCGRPLVLDTQERKAILNELHMEKLEDYARNLLSRLRETAHIRY